jgi:hypothetical protein
MPTTLPTFDFRNAIDNLFTHTWYDVRSQAADNILESTVVWAWLKMKGCLKPQQGGDLIERTVRYAIGTTKAVSKGDVLNQGEIENRTAAFWTFRNLSSHLQRSFFDDRANRGKYRISDYVNNRLEDAMDALKQQYEADLFRAHTTDESGKNIQGLFDLLPPAATRNTGTYGKIARPTTYVSDVPTVGNTWWSPRYKQLTANLDVNLVKDMKEFYNTVTNNQEAIDGIITSKNVYETYTDYGLDQTQLLGNQKLLDLGFTTVKFMGADIIWTAQMTVDDLLFLNSRRLEVVYDPFSYFHMHEWQFITGTLEKIAYITCTKNVVCDQLRRHGRLYS